MDIFLLNWLIYEISHMAQLALILVGLEGVEQKNNFCDCHMSLWYEKKENPNNPQNAV